MGASQSNKVEEPTGNWRDELQRPENEPEVKIEERKEEVTISEETRKLRQDHAAKMSQLDEELQRKKEDVKKLETEERPPCTSETLQLFRQGISELRAENEQKGLEIRAVGAQILIDRIVDRQEDAQGYVDRLKEQVDSQAESRRMLHQAEIEASWEHNEHRDVREICEAGGSKTSSSVTSLYKEIGVQVSGMPGNLRGILGAVNLAEKSGKASFLRNKQKEAQAAFRAIDKNILVITTKGVKILQTVGLKNVEQDFLDASVAIRDESGKILDGIPRISGSWSSSEEDSEDDASWLRRIVEEIRDVERRVKVIGDEWKKVKVPG